MSPLLLADNDHNDTPTSNLAHQNIFNDKMKIFIQLKINILSDSWLSMGVWKICLKSCILTVECKRGGLVFCVLTPSVHQLKSNNMLA